MIGSFEFGAAGAMCGAALGSFASGVSFSSSTRSFEMTQSIAEGLSSAPAVGAALSGQRLASNVLGGAISNMPVEP